MNTEKHNLSSIRKPDHAKIEALLKSGCTDNCRSELEKILDDIRFFEIQSHMLRLYVSMDIFVAARSFCEEIGITDEQFTERFGTIEDIEPRLSTAESIAECLCDVVEQCIKWRISAAHTSKCRVISVVTDYIEHNYMSYDISLSTVADAVGLSPSYLSALFKKECGRNLSEYLTLVRIHRSQELLCCTSKMVYEIAYDVGFHDYKYFSQIFKKYTGQTPREYQTRANAAG